MSLTRVELRIITKYFKLTSMGFLFDWDWNASTQTLSPTKSKLKRVSVLISFFFSFIYFSFLVFRIVPATGYSYSPEESRNPNHAIVFHLFFLTTNICINMVHFGTYFKRQEFCYFLNQLIRFNSSQGILHLHAEYADRNLREKILHLYDIWIEMACVLLMCLFPFLRHDIHYLYTVLPDAWQNGWTLAIFTFLEAFVACKTALVHNFVCYTGFLYVQVTGFWLTKCCIEWPLKLAPTTGKVEELLRSLHIFKTLSILTTVFNQTYLSSLLPVFKTTAQFVGVISLCAFLRLYSNLTPTAFLFLPVLSIFCFFEDTVATYAMSYVHDLSSQLIPNYKRKMGWENEIREEVKGWRKLQAVSIAPCAKLGCNLGGFFPFKRNTKLFATRIMFDGLIFMLMTF